MLVEPKRVHQALRVIASFVAVGAVGAACADLPAIATNQCGNHVIDPTEDCDTFAPSGSSCRAAGTTGECHFDCKGSNACPPSFTCGNVDKICRQATGKYDTADSQTLFAATNNMTFEDFDGDGRADAVTSGVNDLRIHYFDGRLSLAKTLILPLPSAKYHAGSVGNDTLGDITLARSNGLVDVFRGQTDRTVAPVVYSSVPIPETNTNARAFMVRNQVGNSTGDSLERPTGDDIFAFGTANKGAAILDLAGRTAAGADTGTLANTIIALPDGVVDNVAGAIAVGTFIEGWVCDQFAIGFSGDSKVDVYTPCRPGVGPNVFVTNAVDLSYQKPQPVILPLGAMLGAPPGGTQAGTFAADANGDGHIDLIIEGDLEGVPQLYVAYGLGDGTFSSSPTLTPVDDLASSFTAANAITVTPVKKNQVPLAVADLNGDKLLDFVFPGGIVFSEPTRYVLGPSATNGVQWTAAVIVDTNRDGIPDVAAANPNGAIDFYMGTGTASMSYMSYGLDGLPSNLVAGDFDGDLANDVAFAVNGAAGTDGGAASSEIQVLFGQGFAFPAQPTTLGSLPTVVQLASGPLTPPYTGVTTPINANVSSMVALSLDSTSNVFAAILVGNPDRLITSSFALFQSLATQSAPQRAQAQRVITGPFMTGGQNDFLMIGQDPVDLTKFTFWYASSTGEATVDSTNLVISPTLPATYDWASAMLVSTGLDTPTGTELPIAIVGLLGAAGPPQMFIIDPKTLSLGTGIPLSCNFKSGGAATPFLRGADYDSDGFRDALVYCPDVSGKTVLTMFWGDSSGSFAASRSTNIPTPSDPVISVTNYRAGPVLPRSVAMLTANGVFLTTPGGSDGRTFGSVTQDTTLPGGSYIGAADIDGDGVADLGIVDVTKTQVQFFRGIPVNDSSSVP